MRSASRSKPPPRSGVIFTSMTARTMSRPIFSSFKIARYPRMMRSVSYCLILAATSASERLSILARSPGLAAAFSCNNFNNGSMARTHIIPAPGEKEETAPNLNGCARRAFNPRKDKTDGRSREGENCERHYAAHRTSLSSRQPRGSVQGGVHQMHLRRQSGNRSRVEKSDAPIEHRMSGNEEPQGTRPIKRIHGQH